MLKQDGRVEDIFEEIWSELLPHCEFNRSLIWSEAGVDSLKSLHLLLRLEQRLNRPVSFDLLTQQMTIGEMLAVLSAPPQRRPAPSQDRPTLFLLPGILGDEPILAEFRRSLHDRVHFELLPLPDLDAPLQLSTDFSAMANAAADTILERAGGGLIHLAGYSYGGFLAFETARVLKARGTELGLVVLLDALVANSALTASLGARAGTAQVLGQLARFPELFSDGPTRFIDRLAYRLAIEAGAFKFARRLTLSSAGRSPFERNLKQQRELLLHFRGQAIRGWRPGPLNAQVLLVTSDEYEETADPSVWPRLCSRLKVQPVGGRHREIFTPPSLAKLNTALMIALQAAQSASIGELEASTA